MYQVIIIGHVLVGLAVIGLVLIQHGKGADAGAAFGSGSSGTVFGAQGSASFLSRTTGVLAAVFFATSLGLAVLSGNAGNDVDLMDAPIIDQKAAEVPTIAEDNTAPVVITDDVPAIEEEVVTP
ncbi:MAG: preprotein translocase subunit SecG [Methyloprofundus sp.]|nr:preprotein translocase subunit SecG [Methyloprofundus sp.]